MAKQIVWSIKAQSDRKEILKYWRQRNQGTCRNDRHLSSIDADEAGAGDRE